MYTCTYMYMCGNTAYRAIEPLKITAREIPSPRQPYQWPWLTSSVFTQTRLTLSTGIAHRDLKPENILCEYTDKVTHV